MVCQPALEKQRNSVTLIIEKTQLCQHQHILNCWYWIFNFKDFQFARYLDLLYFLFDLLLMVHLKSQTQDLLYAWQIRSPDKWRPSEKGTTSSKTDFAVVSGSQCLSRFARF